MPISLSPNELYAGKLVAALDRQHPRDLFDVMLLLEHEGISSELVDLLVIYLVSSNRPIAELLAPNLQPIQPVFDQQFRGMSVQTVTAEQLEQSRNTMIETVRAQLTDDHKRFLLSFKSGDPDWDRVRHSRARELPAVQWKLQNVQRLGDARRKAALAKLESVLSG
ncbi:MAG TPA: nucleotidyl transferase AbiEii/AbiGii toxin family protein [Gammaproteobacteria bacterium]|nr:nucleotidyl transferase AbiEii/AbiGii toxin family protein [Gammaproteobacteria bacterium]